MPWKYTEMPTTNVTRYSLMISEDSLIDDGDSQGPRLKIYLCHAWRRKDFASHYEVDIQRMTNTEGTRHTSQKYTGCASRSLEFVFLYLKSHTIYPKDINSLLYN